jgi:hypothetical protein
VNNVVKKLVASSTLKRAGIVAVGCVAVSLLGGTSAKGQLGIDDAAIMTFLGTLNSTMQSAMAIPLQTMQQINSDMASFTQTAIYPLQQIQAAQNLASQNLSRALNMQGMINASTANATLPTPRALEATMLSKDPNQTANVPSLYQQTYGTLPASQAAPSGVTAAVDMGDATAMESIKKAIALDALADSEMQVSQQMMNQLETAAPGNVPIISAQAQAWILQAHAYTQSGTAQLLRAQSAELAYTGAALKLHSTVTGNAGAGLFALPVGH